MKTIAAQLATARTMLAPVAGESAALEARLLAAHAWGMSPEDLVREAGADRDGAPLSALVERRMKHEPVAQIVGTREFWRDRFLVSRDVLTPRPDSETLIETLLKLKMDRYEPLRLLDLGTGSGCLILSALREYPNARGVACDRSETALALAQRNANMLGMADRVVLGRSDWFSAIEGPFDVILSNPPYIETASIAALDADVRDHEPHGALDGGMDGLDCYRAILAQAKSYLNEGGVLLFEVGQGQAKSVAQLGRTAGFTDAQIIPDLAGIGRVVALLNVNQH